MILIESLINCNYKDKGPSTTLANPILSGNPDLPYGAYTKSSDGVLNSSLFINENTISAEKVPHGHVLEFSSSQTFKTAR